jgi:hypothetical protein
MFNDEKRVASEAIGDGVGWLGPFSVPQCSRMVRADCTSEQPTYSVLLDRLKRLRQCDYAYCIGNVIKRKSFGSRIHDKTV